MKPLNETKPNHLRGVDADASVPTLIRQLAADATSLFSKEIRLAKTEIYENVNNLKNGFISVGGGALVLYAGLIVLLFAAVAGLANVVDLWLSALIVGVLVSVVGFFMLGAGKKKMDAAAMRPDHTIESLKADKRAAKGVFE